MTVFSIREITIERAVVPAGWFIVTLRDCTEPEIEYSSVWESEELAFAVADHLKRDYAPAILREIGGAK